jgi:Phage integrase, N-terminal SAM-like domain
MRAVPRDDASVTQPRLLDQFRAVMRLRHYSPRTEETYINWVKRFIFFHGKKHPSSMGADEVNAFLTHLAVDERVSATTQNQALCAILFLYRVVLEAPLPWLDEVVRARRSLLLTTVALRAYLNEALNVLIIAAVSLILGASFGWLMIRGATPR